MGLQRSFILDPEKSEESGEHLDYVDIHANGDQKQLSFDSPRNNKEDFRNQFNKLFDDVI